MERFRVQAGISARLNFLIFLGVCKISQERAINEEIRAREVRLIGDDNAQLGIMTRKDALAVAEEKGLDLVLIAPDADPPVCRIMDYGKFRFEQTKREKEARKNQRITELKEVRLSATIEEHDIDIKAKAALRFLTDGDKVKVSIRFRGRQATHPEIGYNVMNVFFQKIEEAGVIEKRPVQEGRNMYMILSPRTKGKK
jgi:translation initiation factor IF-3